ncbi:MAG: hypothetical protein OEV64_13715 [Desulfobulbaceae bacterium]|nr:hypothetical protein [Desulfobulbaceae bacterium]
MKINSIDDAAIFIKKAGMDNWKWTGKASAEGFADWVHRNCGEIDKVVFDEELAKYLISVGENPTGYGLAR